MDLNERLGCPNPLWRVGEAVCCSSKRGSSFSPFSSEHCDQIWVRSGIPRCGKADPERRCLSSAPFPSCLFSASYLSVIQGFVEPLLEDSVLLSTAELRHSAEGLFVKLSLNLPWCCQQPLVVFLRLLVCSGLGTSRSAARASEDLQHFGCLTCFVDSRESA